MIVVAPRPLSRAHWLTAVAPNWVPAKGQLLWLRTVARDLAQQDLVIRRRADVGGRIG